MKLSEIMALPGFRFEFTGSHVKTLEACIIDALGVVRGEEPPAGSELAFCCPLFAGVSELPLATQIVILEAAAMGVTVPPASIGATVYFIADVCMYLAYHLKIEQAQIVDFIRRVENRFESAGLDAQGRPQ